MFLLGEFLVAKKYTPPPFPVNVVVHTHCHQRSLFVHQAEAILLEAMQANYTMLDSGCCGMAGSFGFHPDHAKMSNDIGELVLFPALRKMLERYSGIGSEALRANLISFLKQILPLAEELGMRFAIHPDDPPRPLMGLPRIVSSHADLSALFSNCPSPAKCVSR